VQGKHSIGVLYYLLAREVLRLRGSIERSIPWEVAVDLFFYRDPEELKQLEDQEKAAAPEAVTFDDAARPGYEEAAGEAPVYEAGGFDAAAAPAGWDQTAQAQGGWEGAADWSQQATTY
jgi:small subunit ribosomal protein SAe